MRNLLWLVIPLFVTGCGILSFGDDKLPEVWVVEDVPIRFWRKLEPDDDRLDRVAELLVAMNRRVYDATDGQVRIAKFTVYDTPQRGPGNLGQGELHDPGEHLRAHAAIGSPKLPGVWHFSLHEGGKLGLFKQAAEASHEWFHAYVGLIDEYRLEEEGTSAACSKKWLDRQTSGACTMFINEYSELCRKETHNPKTRQGQTRGMSCYEWLAKTVKDDGKGQIIIPTKCYTGPSNPPDPIVNFVK